jgi:hypothetical protein
MPLRRYVRRGALIAAVAAALVGVVIVWLDSPDRSSHGNFLLSGYCPGSPKASIHFGDPPGVSLSISPDSRSYIVTLRLTSVKADREGCWLSFLMPYGAREYSEPGDTQSSTQYKSLVTRQQPASSESPAYSSASANALPLAPNPHSTAGGKFREG